MEQAAPADEATEGRLGMLGSQGSLCCPPHWSRCEICVSSTASWFFLKTSTFK